MPIDQKLFDRFQEERAEVEAAELRLQKTLMEMGRLLHNEPSRELALQVLGACQQTDSPLKAFLVVQAKEIVWAADNKRA